MSTFLCVTVICLTVTFVTVLILLASENSRLRDLAKQAGKWLLSAFFALLVISPIDFVPDVIPLGGWLDDVGYCVAAVASARAALKLRRESQSTSE